jgi:hypothetical protein
LVSLQVHLFQNGYSVVSNMALKKTWIEASELPEGEKVYLKRDFLGWRTVEPWKNDDGTINKFNLLLGGKRNLFVLVIILIVALSIYLAAHETLVNYNAMSEELSYYYASCQPPSNLGHVGLNLTKINWSVGS